MIVYTMLLSLYGAFWAYYYAFGPTYGRNIDGHHEKVRARAWRGTACAATGFALSAVTLSNLETTAPSLLAAILLTLALRTRGPRRRPLHVAGYLAGVAAWTAFIVTIMGPAIRTAA